MTGDHHQLVERLVAVGLDEREAKLYLHLALRGPSRASDAASSTKLKRTETYRALEGLMRRGFVTAHLAKPVVYEANTPEAVFGDLLASHEQRRGEIERLREHVAHVVAASREEAGSRDGAKRGYKMIQGRRSILQHTETMMRHAGEIALASTVLGGSVFTPQNRSWQTLVRRASEGIPVRLLVRAENADHPEILGLLRHPRVSIRAFTPAHSIRFVVTDAREVVFWLVSEDVGGIEAREDIAMWTNAPDFVGAQSELFEGLWRDAKTVSAPTMAHRSS